MKHRNFWTIFWLLLSVLGVGSSGVTFQNTHSLFALVAMILWCITGCVWMGIWVASWSDED